MLLQPDNGGTHIIILILKVTTLTTLWHLSIHDVISDKHQIRQIAISN